MTVTINTSEFQRNLNAVVDRSSRVYWPDCLPVGFNQTWLFKDCFPFGVISVHSESVQSMAKEHVG